MSIHEPVTTPDAAATGARHILRDRAVAWFLKDPYDPTGAIPNAILNVVGGPPMWSDEPLTSSQFTPEQKDLVIRAFHEIKDLYQAAGGRMQQVMTLVEGIGLMPAAGTPWPYQSEQWAAARAMYVGYSYRYAPNLPEAEREQAELTQAYHVVITWIDYVEGGLLDASAIYDDEDDEEDL
jgi:hypothetical protein